MDQIKVYLAGGMRSGWQDKVKQALAAYSNVVYIDPRINDPKDSKEYTARDLASIDECDLLFGYMETSNPGGYNLGTEVGYAKAKGKSVVFVMSPNDFRYRYFAMAYEMADRHFHTLEQGISYMLEVLVRQLKAERLAVIYTWMGESAANHVRRCGPFCTHVDLCAACTNAFGLCEKHQSDSDGSYTWKKLVQEEDHPTIVPDQGCS